MERAQSSLVNKSNGSIFGAVLDLDDLLLEKST